MQSNDITAHPMSHYTGMIWLQPQGDGRLLPQQQTSDQFIWLPRWCKLRWCENCKVNGWFGQVQLKYAKVFWELLLFPVRRQVTAVCNEGIKNWSCMQGKGCWAPGDRWNVSYEKLKETEDGARAHLPRLLSASTSQQCACSGRKHVVLQVKMSGYPSRCRCMNGYLYVWCLSA